MNYRLIFKNPESGKSVAFMDVVSVNEDAAVDRFREVAGYMEGELWHGETQLRVIAPEPMQPSRSLTCTMPAATSDARSGEIIQVRLCHAAP